MENVFALVGQLSPVAVHRQSSCLVGKGSRMALSGWDVSLHHLQAERGLCAPVALTSSMENSLPSFQSRRPAGHEQGARNHD